MGDQLLPCPYCGRTPYVYHGVYRGVCGDSIECGRDDCPEPDAALDLVWHYTNWDKAVRRWNEHATSLTKQINE